MSNEARSRVAENELLLHEAAIKNDAEAVREALRRPVDVNCRNNYGRAPIHWAASRGNVAIIQMLIEANCNIEAADKFGMRPLLMASWHGHLEAVKTLIDAGACLAVTNKKLNDMLQCACARGAADVAEFALSVGACASKVDSDGNTALILAAKGGHDNAVTLLLESGAGVDLVNKIGHTALHVACVSGHPTTVRVLVSSGANMDLRDNDGLQPLHLATLHKHTDTVRELLDRRCHLNAVDSNGATALHVACAQGCKGIVELLLSNGANLHLQNNAGFTAVQEACSNNHSDIVELLLEHGADAAFQDQWSSTPASICGRPESPPEGFRRAARGSFSAIMDLLTATANLDINHQGTVPRRSNGALLSNLRCLSVTGLYLSTRIQGVFIQVMCMISAISDGIRWHCRIFSKEVHQPFGVARMRNLPLVQQTLQAINQGLSLRQAAQRDDGPRQLFWNSWRSRDWPSTPTSTYRLQDVLGTGRCVIEQPTSNLPLKSHLISPVDASIVLRAYYVIRKSFPKIHHNL